MLNLNVGKRHIRSAVEWSVSAQDSAGYRWKIRVVNQYGTIWCREDDLWDEAVDVASLVRDNQYIVSDPHAMYGIVCEYLARQEK